jgi:hypothetical protein
MSILAAPNRVAQWVKRLTWVQVDETMALDWEWRRDRDH